MLSKKSDFPNRFNFGSDKVLRELLPIWVNDEKQLKYEFGDDCWRAALAHITYKSSFTLIGLIQHFKDGKLFRSLNNIELEKDNCSRDQLIMFLTAIALTCPIDDTMYYASHFKWRISKRYTIFPSFALYHWVQFLSTNNERHAKRFFKWVKLEVYPLLWITLIICRLFDIKPTNSFIPKEKNWLTRQVLKIPYFSFAFHLLCWQIYVMEKFGYVDEGLNQRLVRYLYKRDPKNILCEKLLLRDIRKNTTFVENYKPMNDFRWQRHPDQTCDVYLRELTQEESFYNNIDKDILYSIT